MPIPDVVLQLGAAAAVIVVVVRFLAELRAAGEARERERQAFVGAMVTIVALAQRMVDQCQHGVSAGKRVTTEQIIEAGMALEKGDGK